MIDGMRHTMDNKDWTLMTADCAVCGPDTPMSTRGRCKLLRNQRSRAKYAAGHRSKAEKPRYRVYKGVEGSFRLSRAEQQELKRDRVCEICGTDKGLVIDHCHTKGVFRGILCENCNRMLGMAKEQVSVLEAAIAYLTTKEPLHQNGDAGTPA